MLSLPHMRKRKQERLEGNRRSEILKYLVCILIDKTQIFPAIIREKFIDNVASFKIGSSYSCFAGYVHAFERRFKNEFMHRV